jgi:hypothetical protein
MISGHPVGQAPFVEETSPPDHLEAAAGVAVEARQLSPESGLTMLLTVESLLFAVFAAAIGLASVTGASVRLLPEARRLSYVSAAVLAGLAICAAVQWWYTFVDDRTSSVASVAAASGTGLALVIMPVLAVLIARALRRR